MKLLGTSIVLLSLTRAAAGFASDSDTAKPAPESVAVFTSKCAPCHGKTGTPPDTYAKLGVRKLSDPEWQKSKTDSDINDVISKGSKGTTMRAFKELKPAEIAALVKFVRTLNGAPAK